MIFDRLARGITNRYRPRVSDFVRFSDEIRPSETVHRIVIGSQIWEANSFGQNCLKPIFQNWKIAFYLIGIRNLAKIGENPTLDWLTVQFWTVRQLKLEPSSYRTAQICAVKSTAQPFTLCRVSL